MDASILCTAQQYGINKFMIQREPFYCIVVIPQSPLFLASMGTVLEKKIFFSMLNIQTEGLHATNCCKLVVCGIHQ